jgi:hypothetical protein
MLLGDFGHQRASNEPRERKLLLKSIHRWFDHYLRDRGRPPRNEVTAFAQTCPKDAPAGKRFAAPTFGELARDVLRIRDAEPQTISSAATDPNGAALDPVAGMGDGCAVLSGDDPSGPATYELTPRRRVTLVGSPKIHARLSISGARPEDTEIAARLLDVDPEGAHKRLVARGLYRPSGARARWYLHPAAWVFRPGHTIELQLLGGDPPYARPSNSSFETTVSGLRLSLPVR